MPHIEVLPLTKSANAPGWTYVAERGLNSGPSAAQPASRVRAARNIPNASASETTAKQDAKILRHLAELDKDNNRDVSIPVPVRHRDNAGRGISPLSTYAYPKHSLTHISIVSHGKVTPGVRKILQSQKTFANHLSDAEALAAQTASQPGTSSSNFANPSTPASRASPAAPPGSHLTRTGKRSHTRKNIATEQPSTPLRRVSSVTEIEGSLKKENTAGDVVMSGVDIIPAPSSFLTPVPPTLKHPRDDDPLLRSRIPKPPTDEEIEQLLAVPPLSYLAARATFEGNTKPVRKFCEICGYWGRVKCLKCGSRVCGLECKGVHDESNCVRFYS
jgi:zinc finger HIT domain-containing protein 1